MHYELTYIISAAVPETDHRGVQDEIQSHLDKIEAKITKPFYAIGRKRLAYPINKQKHGFYVAAEFDVDNAAGLKELDTTLKHHHAILRYLVIKRKPESTIKIAKRIPSDAKVKLSISKPVEKFVSRPKPIKAKPVKIDLDDLDKKLDKILADEQ